MTQPLYLVGPRGCGKTTTGMALAKAIDFQFVDTDRWLQSHVQMTVAEIVEREGWEGFRAQETSALQAVTAPATVVATGGGIILTVVIYLSAPVSVLVDRLEATPEEGLRPTLTGKPLTEEVQEVLAQRDVLYREAAHYIVDATHKPAQVVEDILEILAQAAPRLQGGVYT